MYETKESNHLVEEFMLLANISVAKKIYASYPTFSLLRRHPIPPPQNFTSLLKSASLLGVKLDVSTSKTLSNSLDSSGVSLCVYFYLSSLTYTYLGGEDGSLFGQPSANSDNSLHDTGSLFFFGRAAL